MLCYNDGNEKGQGYVKRTKPALPCLIKSCLKFLIFIYMDERNVEFHPFKASCRISTCAFIYLIKNKLKYDFDINRLQTPICQ